MKTIERRRSALLAAVVFAAIAGQPSLATAKEPATTGSTTKAEDAAEGRPVGLLAILFGSSKADPADENPAPSRKVSRSAAPAELRELIRKHAAEHGVPAELAEAVVNVESRFNPKARGRAGEIGLMQIKPATARGIGYRGTTKQLYDPETNLTWGMKYLARAYQLADGDTCGAILRYNGGHAARKMTKGVRAYCSKVKTYVAAL